MTFSFYSASQKYRLQELVNILPHFSLWPISVSLWSVHMKQILPRSSMPTLSAHVKKKTRNYFLIKACGQDILRLDKTVSR